MRDVSISITEQYFYKPKPMNIEASNFDDINNLIKEAGLLSVECCSVEHELLESEDTHEASQTEIHKPSQISISNLLNPELKLVLIIMIVPLLLVVYL